MWAIDNAMLEYLVKSRSGGPQDLHTPPPQVDTSPMLEYLVKSRSSGPPDLHTPPPQGDTSPKCNSYFFQSVNFLSYYLSITVVNKILEQEIHYTIFLTIKIL